MKSTVTSDVLNSLLGLIGNVRESHHELWVGTEVLNKLVTRKI